MRLDATGKAISNQQLDQLLLKRRRESDINPVLEEPLPLRKPIALMKQGSARIAQEAAKSFRPLGEQHGEHDEQIDLQLQQREGATVFVRSEGEPDGGGQLQRDSQGSMHSAAERRGSQGSMNSMLHLPLPPHLDIQVRHEIVWQSPQGRSTSVWVFKLVLCSPGPALKTCMKAKSKSSLCLQTREVMEPKLSGQILENM